MQVKAESIDRKLILHLRGELDHHAARQLMQHIARELEYALPLETELDFSGVTFMDSSGIAVALHDAADEATGGKDAHRVSIGTGEKSIYSRRIAATH